LFDKEKEVHLHPLSSKGQDLNDLI